LPFGYFERLDAESFFELKCTGRMDYLSVRAV